jgi:hypothetical protein
MLFVVWCGVSWVGVGLGVRWCCGVSDNNEGVAQWFIEPLPYKREKCGSIPLTLTIEHQKVVGGVKMNEKCGRMEERARVSKVLRELADELDKGDGFVISGSKLEEALTATRKACKCKGLSIYDPDFSKKYDACAKAGGHYTFVPGLVVSFIPQSKHHNGKPMMFVGDHSDVSTICLEISEEGLFAYYVDDGVS